MKRISILGSTGSIGQHALNVVRQHPEKFRVTALAAKENIDLMEAQAREFHPDIVALYDRDKALQLEKRLSDTKVKVMAGMEGLTALAEHSNVDMVISAMFGILGLKPTIAAIRAGKDIGLANKETLVAGGSLITALVANHGVKLIPIDSEHTAIFQCLENQKNNTIERIILTASGGPFRTFTEAQLEDVTVEQALNHPSWKMGPKVTIDSSTLMNKGLEAIEAHWLYRLPAEKIDMIVHPQSIIHSMVEFVDRSILAQMSENSMTIPIQFAMSYPERHPMHLPRFDFAKHPQLQFFPVDRVKFPCVNLAYEAIRQGGSLPCYMNSANEVLVEKFLAKEIRWKEIATTLEYLMGRHTIVTIDSFETIIAIDAQAREDAKQISPTHV